MKYVKILAIIILVMGFIMWLLNPSFSRFKEFSGTLDNYYTGSHRPQNKIQVVKRRVNNYLLWSIYEVGTVDYKGNYKFKSRYIGIIMNFFDITSKPATNTAIYIQSKKDSSIDTKKNVNDPLRILDTTNDGLPILKK